MKKLYLNKEGRLISDFLPKVGDEVEVDICGPATVKELYHTDDNFIVVAFLSGGEPWTCRFTFKKTLSSVDLPNLSWKNRKSL